MRSAEDILEQAEREGPDSFDRERYRLSDVLFAIRLAQLEAKAEGRREGIEASIEAVECFGRIEKGLPLEKRVDGSVIAAIYCVDRIRALLNTTEEKK